MFKKFSQAAAASLFVFTALSADQMDSGKGMTDNYAGGWFMGPTVSDFGGGTYWAAMVGYMDDWFLVDFSAGYTHLKLTSIEKAAVGRSSLNVTPLAAHLGMRENIAQNLYVTYGVEGYVAAGELPSHGKRPYAVGAFAGLDYQISRHYLLSGKINGFNFYRDSVNTKAYSVFNTGTVSVAYVF